MSKGEGKVMLVLVSLIKLRLPCVTLGQLRLTKVSSGQVNLGYIRLCRSGLFRSC